MAQPTFPVDYNLIRKTFANEIQKVTGLTAVLLEPETQEVPRPSKPYFGFKITAPGFKYGDDSKQHVSATKWNSGGNRKMTVSFECFGQSHEEAYNYMALWQTSLDLENVQADLRKVGIAVWTIGTLADLSALLNTGYEGRSQMDCFFGINMNLQSDLGAMESVTVEGTITTDQGSVVHTSITVPEEE